MPTAGTDVLGVSARTSALFLVGGLTIAAAAIRFSTLGVQSYWADEGYTVRLVNSHFRGMLESIPKTESTPPLYYVLAWAWARAFGTSEVALRSLSALLGTALVPVAYLTAATVAGRRVALAAATLVVVNPLLVWYSQEARSYALLALLVGLSLLACVQVVNGRERAATMVWTWGFVSALALAAHYFAVFVVAPEAIWLLLARPRLRRRIWLALIPVVAIGCALLPLVQHQRNSAAQAFAFQSQSLPHRGIELVKQFLVGFDLPSEQLVSLIACACVLVAAVELVRRGDRRRVVPLAIVTGTSILLPFALAAGGLDYLKTQNLLASLLPCTIVAAAGFVASRIGVAALTLLVGLSLLAVMAVDTNAQFQREDWRDPLRLIGAPAASRAIVLTPEPGPVLDYYQPRTNPLPGAGGISVREVDLIGLATKPALGRFEPPNVTPANDLRGFEAHVVTNPKFTLVRYVSSRPRLVTDAELRAARLGDWAPDRATIVHQQK